MAGQFRNQEFERDDYWELAGLARYAEVGSVPPGGAPPGAPQGSGSRVMELQSERGFMGDRHSTCASLLVPSTVGERIVVGCWIDATRAGPTAHDHVLNFEVQDEREIWFAWDSIEEDTVPTDGWFWKEWAPIVPVVGTWIRVRWQSDFDQPSLGTGEWFWYLDRALVKNENVAVLLSERARKALMSQMQAHLETEIRRIDRERNDGLILEPVKQWFSYRRAPEDRIEQTRLEVYSPQGAVAFNNWTAELGGFSTKISGDPMPLTSETTVLCRLTYRGRDHREWQIQDAADRYLAAMVRVIRNDVQLGFQKYLHVTSLAATVDADEKREGHNVVELSVGVHLTEDSSGEGSPGGGQPPDIEPERFVT